MTKEERQAKIVDLVRRRRVRTQGDLTRQLARSGVEVDQSTLSRDLRELGVSKKAGYYGVGTAEREPASFEVDYSAAVAWFTICGPNMIVISTRVGQAQPVALAIEGQDDPSIVATLAGDDTIFVATKTRRTQSVALRRLKQWFGDKQR
ncbi:MAG: arginine repressor [Planctomycetota bacterium]|jgi:transcriptional regulator of arginine metabolism